MKQEKSQKHFELKQYSLIIISSIIIFSICSSLVIIKLNDKKRSSKANAYVSQSIVFDNLEIVSGKDLPLSENSETQEEESANTVKININTADIDELKSLKGIGDVKAKAIIDFRNENGDFTSIFEILDVKGIGEKTFENIKNFIAVQ